MNNLGLIGIVFGTLGMAIGLVAVKNYITAITGVLAIGLGLISQVKESRKEDDR